MKHANRSYVFCINCNFYENYFFFIPRLEIITKLSVKNMRVFNQIQVFFKIRMDLHTARVTVVHSGSKQMFSQISVFCSIQLLSVII